MHKIDEIADMVCRNLGQFAAPGKLPDCDQYHVQRWYPKSGSQMLRVVLVTPDDLLIEYVLDIRELTAGGRDWFRQELVRIAKEIEAKRSERLRQESPLILNLERDIELVDATPVPLTQSVVEQAVQSALQTDSEVKH